MGRSSTSPENGATSTALDLRAVTDWLATHVPGLEAPLEADLVAGGHSCLTYVLTDAAGARLVLRRPPPGHTLATAHDVAREHRIMGALAASDVPVPRMLGLADDTVIGTPFFVMEHVEGAVLHDASQVPDSLVDVEARRRLGHHVVDVLAALHAVDVDDIGLGDLSRRSGYLGRQLRRWSGQWEASTTRDLPGMERLHRWLVEHRPTEPPATIVHGDYRLGNLLVRPEGRVAAVLDWELCTLGDPSADLSYLLRSWVPPEDPAVGSIDPPTRAGGFPTRDELVERYRERSGRGIEDLDYWMAFNAWRSAAIGEGVYRRYLDRDPADRPEDLTPYADGVVASMRAGLTSAGLD